MKAPTELRPTRRPAWMLVVVTVILVGAAMVTNVIPFRQIVEQRTEIADAEARLEALTAENELLTGQVDALNTPAEIERLAREKLGYVHRGETAFVILEPDSDDATAYPEDGLSSSPETEERSFFQRIWNFLTGSDLSESP